MDYQPNIQPSGQTPEQPPVQQEEQATEQEPSGKVWYIVALAAVVALGLAYFALRQSATNETPTDAQAVTEQTTSPAVTSGNTTADIANDLGQIPDASADLDADASAAAADLQSL